MAARWFAHLSYLLCHQFSGFLMTSMIDPPGADERNQSSSSLRVILRTPTVPQHRGARDCGGYAGPAALYDRREVQLVACTAEHVASCSHSGAVVLFGASCGERNNALCVSAHRDRRRKALRLLQLATVAVAL